VHGLVAICAEAKVERWRRLCRIVVLRSCVMFGGRSTKGASKQRRDAINDRVAQIRELLPVSEAARSRLSQLQVMALAKSYIAKSNLFSTINRQY